jgi:ketosteroid isomerase-like protein
MSKSGEIFAYLLERGADIEKPDGNGLRPLDFAVFGGLEEWADRLLDLGADVNAHGNAMGLTPLHMAVRGGRSGLVERLLAAGARLDIRDGLGYTPLLAAAGEGRSEIVGRLLAAGASVDDRDGHGSTALHLACLNGHRAVVESLIAAHAPLQVKNVYGNTPWSLSTREGRAEMAALLRAAGAAEDGPNTPLPEGTYLGQKPPGSHPALFAPGVVSTEKKELNSVFTPDGREFYFTIQDSQGRWTIMVMSRAGESWTPPQPAAFSGSYSDVDLFITPDGKELFFCSNRPAVGAGAPKRDFDIWVVDRIGGGWGPPRNPGPPVNSDANEYFPALTGDGTLYFQSQRPGGHGAADIYRAELRDGAYREAENLGLAINSPGFEGDALISPDEAFLIVSVDRPGGFGRGDLHISFRGHDGSWSIPVNMGATVNTKANENCPILSPDGKYLFFTSADDIYWVSAQVIETLKASAGREVEREDIRRTISACIGWAKDKNLDLFYSVIAHDDDYVSVSPGARIVKRFEDVKQNVPFWMSPDFKYVRHELKDLEITFSRGGDVAWFFCILDDINTYKGEPASWENTRWTGTVEKRDGRWIIVQQHFSFAQDR